MGGSANTPSFLAKAERRVVIDEAVTHQGAVNPDVVGSVASDDLATLIHSVGAGTGGAPAL